MEPFRANLTPSILYPKIPFAQSQVTYPRIFHTTEKLWRILEVRLPEVLRVYLFCSEALILVTLKYLGRGRNGLSENLRENGESSLARLKPLR